MIFKAYIDDSGTHSDSPVTTLGCLVSPATKWNGFDSKWRALLAKYEITSYRTSRLRHRNRQFGGWSEQRREAFLDDMEPIIRAHTTFGFSIAIKRADYDEHYRREGPPAGGRLDSVVGLCFRYCMGWIPQKCAEVFPGDPPKVSYVFASGTGQGDAERIFSEVQEGKTKYPVPDYVLRSARSIIFRSMTDALPLQAADAMATNAYFGEMIGAPNIYKRPDDATFADDVARVSKGPPLYRQIIGPQILANEREAIDSRKKRRGPPVSPGE